MVDLLQFPVVGLVTLGLVLYALVARGAVPLAALAPVLVFLALNITAQAFGAVPARHALAVAISFFPSIARLLSIELSDSKFVSQQRFSAYLLPRLDGTARSVASQFCAAYFALAAVLVLLSFQRRSDVSAPTTNVS